MPAHHRSRSATRLTLSQLEDRLTPSSTAAVSTIREVTAAGPQANAQAGIQAAVDAFRADLGDPNNGNAVGSQGAGRRQITWDGGDNDAAPARLPADFFNAIAPRGAIFGGDPRIQFQVSADATPAVPGTLDEFGNVNATYPTAFSNFSSPRLFTSLNDNVMEVEFFVPGSLERATVSGFGAVFTDVDVAGSSKIEFFDANGQEIFERQILATPGNESLSFLGVKFVGAPLAKVRITAGSAPLGPNDVTQTPGNPDIVVLDDFIYGEPQPVVASRLAPSVVAGGQVVVLDANNGNTLAAFQPYPGFFGAVSVAQGDVNGDGVDDIITGAGPGLAGAPVKVFNGTNFAEISSFFAFDPSSFNNGVTVAAGNVNGDANMDIIIGAGPGASGGRVRVVNGAQTNNVLGSGEIAPAALLANFFAFDPGFTGGLNVGSGDLNGDFLDDILVASSSNNAVAIVKAINATQLNNVLPNGQINPAAELRNFSPFNGVNSGVSVAGGDINGDGRTDIVTSSTTGPGEVRVFNGITNFSLATFLAHDASFSGGVQVATGHFDPVRQIANIVTSPASRGDNQVEIHGLLATQVNQFALPVPPGPSGVLAVSGTLNGSASLFVPNAAGQYPANPDATVNPFPGFAGQVRTAVADVDNDGILDTVAVTGPGTPIRLAVVSGADNTTLLVQPFDPFGGGFTGGGFVTAGDIDGLAGAEFAVTPDQGGGPRVTIFSLIGGVTTSRANFLAIQDNTFFGGARPALGDVNNDGSADLLVAAGFGGGPRVALFNGATLFTAPAKIVNDFFAFPEDALTLRNGVFAALGDIDGDGFADLIFGGGPGGGPRVNIISGALVSANNVAGAQAAPIANFFVAGNSTDRGGVRVTTKDADGDLKEDLIVGSGEGSPARVRIYLGKDFTSSAEPGTFQDLNVFGGVTLNGGVFVG